MNEFWTIISAWHPLGQFLFFVVIVYALTDMVTGFFALIRDVISSNRSKKRVDDDSSSR